MKSSRSLLPCLVLVAACGGGDDATGDDVVSEGVTYYEALKPVVDAKCVSCHTADGIAPFALDTFADLVEHAAEVELNVAQGVMPPWPPDPECNDYFAERSLDDDQKALFTAWVEDGRLEGNAANEAEPIDVETSAMSRVDVSMEMSATYTPQTTADNPDDYRCFIIPFPDSIDTTKYITGFRAVPGNPKVVHHVIAFYASPGNLAEYQALDDAEPGDGYTCFGAAGGASQPVMLGGWAPGSLGSDFPPDTGLRIEPGSAVIMQVHYNVLTAGVEPDQTRVEMKIDDAVDKVAIVQPWANPSWLNSDAMHIPAGEEDVMHEFAFDATFLTGGAFTIYAAGMHQHTLGTQNKATIERADGSSECLVQIDDWNFHWQGSYGLREPTVFNPGDALKVECHWDNSPENQPMVNGEQRPPADVYWGEGTTDEMCVGFFYLTEN